MLVTNPITYTLYDHGYNGFENIYEYWSENKEEILEYISRKKPKLLKNSNYLEEFELKVRWGSPIGMLMRFEIRKMLRKAKAGALLNFKDIQVKYGIKAYNLGDFEALYPCNNKTSNKVDLRGISMINHDIKNAIIQNVDFGYASLDSSTMTKVTFNECNLEHVRFCSAQLIDCVFDNHCSLDYIDFSRAYICAVFNGPIIDPIITKLRRRDILGILTGADPRWRNYTEVWGRSFAERCEADAIYQYIPRLQVVLEKAYNLSQANLLFKIIFMLQQFVKPLKLRDKGRGDFSR